MKFCNLMLWGVWLSLIPLSILISPVFGNDVYFGTAKNNSGKAAGVYVSRFDAVTGKLKRAKVLLELGGAGWVAKHPRLPVLYSTGDINQAGAIVAIDLSNSPAKVINSQPTGGLKACFVTPDKTGQLLISAQYGGGCVSVFPIEANGAIGPRSQLIKHRNPSRVHKNQKSVHPHYVSISPDNRFALVCDLGADKIVSYQIDLETKQLKEVSRASSVPGGGPRHMKFSRDGKFALVLNELTLSVSVFQYDADTGTLKMVDTTEALTSEEKSINTFNSASEIRIHPSGKFVYSANRGHDSITIFSFDITSGRLERVGLMPIRGSWPRNFNLSPAGDFLLAAGQNSNSISVFAINQETGTLQYVQHSSTFVPAPMCVTFAQQ